MLEILILHTYTMQLLASDAAGLMDALKIQKANVLGYSLGSFTAQQFTVSYPDRLTGLYLLQQHVVGRIMYLHLQSLRNCNPKL